MSKSKSTIDRDLGKKAKAIRDLRRAMYQVDALLTAKLIHSAILVLQTIINDVNRDLPINNKSSLPCKRKPAASGKKLRPLKKPGTNA